MGRDGPCRGAGVAGLPDATPQAVIPASPPSEQVFSKVKAEQPERLLKVVFVGRLVHEKGVDTILEALANPQRRTTMELMIVGEGPERRRLESLAHSLGVTATFRGRLDASATHDAMAQGHVVVVPSRSVPRWTEQWGRSAVEAMMTGRPVLVSDSGKLRVWWGLRQGYSRRGIHVLWAVPWTVSWPTPLWSQNVARLRMRVRSHSGPGHWQISSSHSGIGCSVRDAGIVDCEGPGNSLSIPKRRR